MQINLRKANAIQAEIKRAISAIVLETQISVNEFTPSISDKFNEARQKLEDDRTRKAGLVESLYEIRRKVGVANASSGINELLNAVELIDARAAIENNVVLASPMLDRAEINARVEKAKTATVDNTISIRPSLYRDANIVSGILQKIDIDVSKLLVKSLKREKQAIQDELLQLNVNTLIELSATTVDVLKEEGII